MARRKYSRKQNKKTFKSKRKTIRKTKTNKKTNKKTKKGGSFDETPSQTEKMKLLSKQSIDKRAYFAFWKNYFCYKMETYIEFPLKELKEEDKGDSSKIQHIEFPLKEETTTKENIKAIAEHYTKITENMKVMEENEKEIIGKMKDKAYELVRQAIDNYDNNKHFIYNNIIGMPDEWASFFATGALEFKVFKGKDGEIGMPNTTITYDEKYTEEIINQKFKELREKNKDLIEENDKLYKEKILPVIKAYDKVIITKKEELEKFRKGEYPTPVQLSKLQTDSERAIIFALFKDISRIPDFLPFANWCNISIEEMKKLKGRDEEFTFHLGRNPNKKYK